MRRKNLYICALLTSCVLLTACNNSSTDDSTSKSTTKQEQSKESEVAETVTGIIQSVEDSTITLAVMNIPEGDVEGGEQMEMPEGGQMPEGEQPQMPEGGQMPEGEQPQMPEGGQMQELDGEQPQMPEGGQIQGLEGGQLQSIGGEQSQMPEGEQMGMPEGEQPEMPEGELPQMPEGEQMEMPQGGMMNGEAETKSIKVTTNTVITDASGNEITIEDLSVPSMVTVELDAEGNAISISVIDMASMGGMGGNGQGVPGGNNQGAPSSYEALNNYTEDTELSNETISSTGTDENAVLVSNGASVSLAQMVVNRTSTDSTGGDNSSFYGIGAAILTTDGTVEVTGSTIETNAAGGAGVFAYGSGVAYVSDTTITTTQNTSGGIHVAGGGTLYASNLTIETNGESAAAIRSDRGGGTMTVDGGSYTSNGSGSPALYCTANITVENATLNATGSEAVCIEGLNSLALTECDVTGNMPDLSQNDCTWTVILYQSMSGDSEIGNSTFTMNGGSLTSKNGGIFYTTNTESTFYISDVDITSSADCEFFLKCTGNQNERGWGQSGANGANCIFTADAQEMNGNIIWDSISTLDFTMENRSTLTGAFIQDESAAGNGGDGYANLSIDETSTWIVTADSTLGALTSKGNIVDANGNTVTIKGTDGTVYVEGTSQYTITVSSYNF